MWEWKDSNLLSRRHLIYSQRQLSNVAALPNFSNTGGIRTHMNRLMKAVPQPVQASVLSIIICYGTITTFALSDTAPIEADTNVVPVAIPNTSPVSDTRAVAVLAVLHENGRPANAATLNATLSTSNATAVYWRVAPTLRSELSGDTTM